MKAYDLIGQRFGSLEVKERIPSGKKVKWRCVCDCGKEDYYVTTSSLISGKTYQCNECGKKATGKAKRKSHIGEKHGMLTIVDEIYHYNGTKRKVYVCECECGKTNVIKDDSYKFSNISSCGCNTNKAKQLSQRIDITGNKYGRLLVKEVLWDEKPIKVRALCDCGKEVILNKRDVMYLHTQSCGCLQKERASQSNYVDYTGYVSESGVQLIKPYKQNKRGVWIWECECGFCGNHFYEIPIKIKNNHTKSCGCMKESWGETYITQILDEHKIKYQKQYSFDDCRNKNRLRFDFAILNEDCTISTLIEYDGQQHFKPVSIFQGEERYENTKKRDEIKDNYCKEHNIPLIRLPYYLSNDEILQTILSIKKP